MTRWRAPAKVNLTLHVLGRREDGYHELDSVTAFAGACDWLDFTPGPELALETLGPSASDAGPDDDNLVLRASRALAGRVSGLKLGRFRLTKLLPVAAGLGGGSSDAAAALRALAHHNRLAFDDPRLTQAARETGADVTVCLAPRARMMRGAGERVSSPLGLRPLAAVLVNPRVALPTAQVFSALGLARGQMSGLGPSPQPGAHEDAFTTLALGRNDMQAAAEAAAPEITIALAALAATAGAAFVRMSGSGATCFALYPDRAAAVRAAAEVRSRRPGWWVRATMLR